MFSVIKRSWLMRYAAGHKEQTRAKILRAAGKVFRRAGVSRGGG